MADILSSVTGHGGNSGGDAGHDVGGGIGGGGFDLSKVLSVDNNTSFDQTHYSDHQNSSQDHSVVDNGSEHSVSYGSDSGDDGGSNSYASHDQDFGGSSSDSADASHNVDYNSHHFSNDFSLDSSLVDQQHHDGGLLGVG